MAYNKEYYLENRNKVLEYQKIYREKYPEKNKERLKKYREKNLDKHAGYERKRRAIKRNSPSEKYTVEQILEIYGSNCHICGKEIDLNANRRSGYEGWEMGLQLDHIVPISKNGADTIENIRPSHGICNVSKNRYGNK